MATRKPATEKKPAKAAAKPTKPAARTKPAAQKPAAPVEKVSAAKKPPAKAKKSAVAVPLPETEAATAAVPPPPAPVAAPKKSKPAPEVEAVPELDGRVLAVLGAIREGRALEFIFEDGDTNPPRTFEPRLLCFDALSKAWYAWGWDRRYNAERHHRIDLLQEVNPVDGLGRAAQGPFKEGTPPNLIGGWLGGEPIPVKAVLMKQWIFAVKQAPPAFPEFRIEDIEDGKAQVTFTATDLRAIARWCMQFGDGIQVQEPQRLVDRIKQVGVTWGGKPRTETEAPKPAPPVRPASPPPLPPPPRREAEEKPKGKGPKTEVRIERL